MVEFFLNILGNALVKSVAGDGRLAARTRPSHADHGDYPWSRRPISITIAAHGFADIQPCAKGGGDRLFN